MDINYFREEKHDLNLLRENQKKRFQSTQIIDDVANLDKEWRKLQLELNKLNKESNALSNEINKQRKEKTDNSALIENSKQLKKQIAVVEEQLKEKLKQRDEKLYTIGNWVHSSVPLSNDEKDNLLVKTWGTNRETTADLHHHHVILHMLDGYETEIGSKVAGHRGYYLKGIGVILNQALINYGLEFLSERGYLPVQTPFFMKKSTMAKVAALAEFNESLYKVSGNEDEEDKYLIATSEQPCCALNMGTTINPKSLPIKYVGYSTCFRKEAGSHGKDVWGIFRVHQFEKIEQFVLAPPNKSWEIQEEMLAVSEEFYQSLGLSYRVVSIVSGELNNAASKKYDLEAWFPTLGTYRELVSCSNCTDYQARRLDIKYGSVKNEDGGIPYVHMLNSTLTATERTICCILENYQTPQGLRIPEVLKKYILPYLAPNADKEVIPFKKGPPAVGKGAKGKEQGQPKENN